MKYKKDKGKSDFYNLKILGKAFVKNNRNKGKIIIENKKYYPNEYIQLNNFKKAELKIDILLYEDISNISYMFNNCESLVELSMKNNIDNEEINCDFSEVEENKDESEYIINKIDENKGTLYEGLTDNIIIFECSEISKKEESEETESIYLKMANLQINNKSKEIIYKIDTKLLSPLYDKLNFNNVNDMHLMFYNCKSLSSLPDISKWITNNVNDMSFMFYNCESLSSLPDISKWNTNNVNDMRSMFYNCKLLSSLPDISKWITSNVNDMNSMFYNCKLLSSLPDLSK